MWPSEGYDPGSIPGGRTTGGFFWLAQGMDTTIKPSHHRRDGFCNSNPEVVIGQFPWYEMVWRTAQGHFKPKSPPAGGYEAFARDWTTPVDHDCIGLRHDDPVVTWLGHVTILLQVGGLNILIDPTLASFAGPYGRMGAPRRVPPPLKPQDLPPIDLILISHNHYDHLCEATLMAMMRAGQRPQICVPLGLKQWFDTRHIRNVIELDWWDQFDVHTDRQGNELAKPIRIHLTPSQHWSRRTPFDTNATLWGGYLVQWMRTRKNPWQFLFPGDTGYSDDFKTIRRRMGPVDFLALPIGAYLPRDFMKNMHVNPADAVQLMLDLEARQCMGVHWGTFMLTQEAFDDPPRELALALKARGVDPDRVWLMKHGESRAALPLA